MRDANRILSSAAAPALQHERTAGHRHRDGLVDRQRPQFGHPDRFVRFRSHHGPLGPQTGPPRRDRAPLQWVDLSRDRLVALPHPGRTSRRRYFRRPDRRPRPGSPGGDRRTATSGTADRCPVRVLLDGHSAGVRPR
uniref:(northern house mosquito) hypothetical protein n=1 Tax=Culex pipiens TaxID=7175 RepID=A0A8D8FRF2_CULPI